MRDKALTVVRKLDKLKGAIQGDTIGISEAQFLLTVYACGDEGIKLSNLTKTLHCDPSRITRLVSRFGCDVRFIPIVELFLDNKDKQGKFVRTTRNAAKILDNIIKILGE